MRVAVVLWMLVFVACDRGAMPTGAAAHGTAGGSPTLELEPPADLEAAAPITRLVVGAPGEVLLTEDVVLVEGTLGKAHLRELAKGEPSAALRQRMVPAVTFARDRDVVLAPEAALPSGVYSVGIGRLGWSHEVRVVPLPHGSTTLSRVWPPRDRPGAPTALVYCGPGLLAASPAAATLEPGGPSGTFDRGIVAGESERCVRFRPSTAWGATGTWVPPPILAEGLFLDPSPLQVSSAASEATAPVECGATETGFGLGCATVADDRLLVRAPGRALLWSVRAGGLDLVRAVGPGQPFTVKGLEPSAEVALEVTTLDADGREADASLALATGPPRAHVVLNEVLANPIGPEPAQEWIELYNDGLVEADLGGMQIVDVGGVATLPSATLAAGGFALVVSEAFSVDDPLDPAPAPDVLLVRVPKLGKGGLSNAGEPLELRSADGLVESRFPGSPKPKPGISVVRVRPEVPDDAEGSFALSQDGASPGRWNHPASSH